MQEIVLVLYALSVLASYPNERKPDILTPTMSVFLKALAVLVFLLGVFESVFSLSGGELREWIGITAIVVILTAVEAVSGGVDAIVSVWASDEARSSDRSMSPDTDDTDGNASRADHGLSRGRELNNDTERTDPKRRTAETDLDRIRDHLDDIEGRSGGRSAERIADRLSGQFEDVQRITDESIIINGDVIIDNHEEHEQTEVTRISDETSIDDSVINRSNIGTEPAVDRDET